MLVTALGLLMAMVAVACGSDDDTDETKKTTGTSAEAEAETKRIVVGSKLDTEAQLLGHLLAATLEAKGYEVSTKIPLGNTDITRKALESGRIDVYWEFTSSGLSLLREKPVGDPQAAYEKVKTLDAENGITWLPAATMNDTYALAVREEGGPVAAATLTELAGYLTRKPDTPLCVDPEGGFREDVLPLLKTTYGIEFTNTRQLGYELIPPAVAQGECHVGIVYSTAALIVKSKLAVLVDDRQAFGAYTPAPTVRTDRVKRWPELAADLADLTAAIDTPTITKLNARVDIDGVAVEQVAREFLTERDLLRPSEESG